MYNLDQQAEEDGQCAEQVLGQDRIWEDRRQDKEPDYALQGSVEGFGWQSQDPHNHDWTLHSLGLH